MVKKIILNCFSVPLVKIIAIRLLEALNEKPRLKAAIGLAEREECTHKGDTLASQKGRLA